MMMTIPELRNKYSHEDITPIEEIRRDWIKHFCNVDYGFLEKTLEKMLSLTKSHGFTQEK